MNVTELRKRARRRERVHRFEDFTVGQRFEHHWGRTLTEADNTVMSTLTLAFNPVYFNRETALATGHAGSVVNPMFLLMTTVGLSVEDLSESGGAFLGIDELTFHRPVLVGETLTAVSTVLATRRSDSRPGMGIVTWHTEGYVDGEPVIDFRRTNLIKAADGEGNSAPPDGELYFDDFVTGEVYEHARGKTVTDLDGVLLCNLAMNTASGHFDEESMKDTPFGQRIVFGGVTASLVIGLTMQDTAEHAVRELTLDGLRFPSPVFHGDTLYAYTEVLSTKADDDAAGVVCFRHWGVNQRDEIVLEAERTVLLNRRPA
ncbi:MaoC family dehydratase [Streptomyces sp. BH106]|uniref:MaoC family dehydratase n=1 Tax=Streptomyces sp. BH106 TaxID=3410409 RepID=UPI003CF6A586